MADELHFGRAADRHYVSAGHFGRRIQQVERVLGHKVFHRTSRRVQLTPAGFGIVAQARVVLAALDKLCEISERIPHEDVDVLWVGKDSAVI
ncbi:LysR family transcriptional regulator [Nocardia sp. NBC_01009]|uniref:LysR family transcriptional regulator n=1 Tax=Nocardia sp. NBC_01009 TaxID=2975996 RepID=UPI0038704212|nr:LysR family transcriptional regulator [Nocardia sp. NBC_01009]